jgi:hypothetical protein
MTTRPNSKDSKVYEPGPEPGYLRLNDWLYSRRFGEICGLCHFHISSSLALMPGVGVSEFLLLPRRPGFFRAVFLVLFLLLCLVQVEFDAAIGLPHGSTTHILDGGWVCGRRTMAFKEASKKSILAGSSGRWPVPLCGLRLVYY